VAARVNATLPRLAALSSADKLAMRAPPKWDTTPYCSAPPRRKRCTAMAMDSTPSSCVAAIWCSRCTWPVDDQEAQSGAGGGGGVAENPGSLLPASGIWQPRIRAILVAYSNLGKPD
jgi:hypothetical protein